MFGPKSSRPQNTAVRSLDRLGARAEELAVDAVGQHIDVLMPANQRIARRSRLGDDPDAIDDAPMGALVDALDRRRPQMLAQLSADASCSCDR